MVLYDCCAVVTFRDDIGLVLEEMIIRLIQVFKWKVKSRVDHVLDVLCSKLGFTMSNGTAFYEMKKKINSLMNCIWISIVFRLACDPWKEICPLELRRRYQDRRLKLAKTLFCISVGAPTNRFILTEVRLSVVRMI